MALGYILPAVKKDTDEDLAAMGEDEIKQMINREVDGVKEHISDIVDETVTYSMEKTERAMERLANEKIMAVNEYSDTVLEEINKNHKEVLFLYDMLNDKHESLKSTLSDAGKTVEEVKQTLKDAEITAKEAKESADGRINTVFDDGFVPIMPPRVEIVHKPEGDFVSPNTDMPKEEDDWLQFISAGSEPDVKEEAAPLMQNDEDDGSRNSNDRILELHKAGKSDITIAKELGLGIGEVKLVIDLYEGM